MFGFNRQVRDLETRIKKLKDNFEIVERREAEALAIQEQENRAAAVAIAWEKLDVFSVERQFNRSGGPATIIGYFFEDANGNRITKEWVIWCNIEIHNKLVQEFNETRKK